MTETRERYLTDSEAYGGPLFQVELIDSKGKSHGFIGYRFHTPGAQAAADGWNNQRERFDLVAVIKPFEEPKPQPQPVVKQSPAEILQHKIENGHCITDDDNYWLHPLVEAGKASAEPEINRHIRASRRIVSEQIRSSQNDVIVMHAMLRSHNHLLMKTLKACARAIDGIPPYYRTKSLERARELAGQVLNQLE